MTAWGSPIVIIENKIFADMVGDTPTTEWTIQPFGDPEDNLCRYRNLDLI